MQFKKRRDFLLATAATATASLVSAIPGVGHARSVVPVLAKRNAYQQANLAASKKSYNAKFTFDGMVDAWGIAIRPAGAGGHFWVTAGGTSYQFVGDVTASATPLLQTLYQDGLKEVYIPASDALTTAASLGKVTGTAYNGALITSNLFRVTAQSATVSGKPVAFDGSARFVFVTDSGTISAWTDRAADGTTVRVKALCNWCLTVQHKACRSSALP